MTTSTTRMGPIIGSVVDGRYRILRQLGTGAMGTVFEAQSLDGTPVALKTVSGVAPGSKGLVTMTRFLRESQISIWSPNIASVLDAGVDPAINLPYFVMPLLRGEDLEQTVSRLGPLDPMFAIRIAVQACDGLDAAHQSGIIHRDIKPANLFLHQELNQKITVKLCDFGVARMLTGANESLTQTGHLLGTPLFMSPEQTKEPKSVDGRGDVWSLGMTLYYALAATTPWANESLGELIVSITTREVPSIQSFAPWVSSELARVLHGTLIRERQHRCPNMRALKRALLSLCGSSEITVNSIQPVSSEMRSISSSPAILPATWIALESLAPSETPNDRIGTFIGSYRIHRCIASGGMGSVYEAIDPQNQHVALKIIHREAALSTKAQHRFVREAKASISIAHPNVVHVIEADTDPQNEAPYIAMELVNGNTLSHLIKQQGPLNPAAVAQLFIQICHGLEAAHDMRIIHRDIKPANILLHIDSNGVITPKVADFGIAKHLIANEDEDTTMDLTRTGGVVGSPMYMSPEQAKNAKLVDARTDIWSVGISLYEALTGRRPWEGQSSPGELIVAICTQEPPPLLHYAPWVSPEFAEVVHHALMQNVTNRHASARDFALALEPFALQSTALTLQALTDLPTELRTFSAPPRAANAKSVSIDKTRSRHWFAGLTAVAAVFAIATVATLLKSNTPSISTEPPLSSESIGSITTTSRELPAIAMTVRVPVRPPSAEVRVNGKNTALDNGNLVLTGEAGDSFSVDVTVGKMLTKTTITLTKEGRAAPPNIDASSDHKKSIEPSGASKTAAPSEQQNTSPKPTAEPTLKPRDDWGDSTK